MPSHAPSWLAAASQAVLAALTRLWRTGPAPQPPPTPAPSATPATIGADSPTRRRTDPCPATRVQPRLAAAAPAPKAPEEPLEPVATHEQLCSAAHGLMSALQGEGASLCLVCVEIDGLDELAARYGDDAVTQVLRLAAKRLRHLARSEDVVLRDGAHAFVLMLACPGGDDSGMPGAMSERVMHDLQRPYAYRTLSNVRVTCTAGAARWPEHGADIDHVLRHAREVRVYARQRRVLPRSARD